MKSIRSAIGYTDQPYPGPGGTESTVHPAEDDCDAPETSLIFGMHRGSEFYE